MSQQCHTVKKANIILGYINRSLLCKTREAILPLRAASAEGCSQSGTPLRERGERPKASNKNNQRLERTTQERLRDEELFSLWKPRQTAAALTVFKHVRLWQRRRL